MQMIILKKFSNTLPINDFLLNTEQQLSSMCISYANGFS